MRKWTFAVVTATVMVLTGCSLLAGPMDVEELQLAVGECVTGESVTEENLEQVGVLPVVDCSQSHHGEVYFTVTMTDEDYPDDAATRAQNVCYEEYEGYVGIAYDDSIYYFTATYPSPESWDSGDRQIACMVVGDEGEQLTGSLRGAAA